MQVEPEWPAISVKDEGLERSVVEEDQIFVIEVQYRSNPPFILSHSMYIDTYSMLCVYV